MKRNILLMLTLALPLAVHAQTEVPHEFQPGTRALSAEVNENFDTLETAVNDNGTRITATEADIAENAEAIQANESNIDSNSTGISVNSVSINENRTAIENNSSAITTLTAASGVQIYSQGESIGRFLGPFNYLLLSPPDYTSGAGIINFGNFWAISDEGYVFLVNPFNDPSAPYLLETEIVFSGEDCTGDAYLVLDTLTAQTIWAAVVGHVVRLTGPLPQPVYYTPKGSEVMPTTSYLSVYTDTCRNEPGTSTFAVRVLSNDPEITGVANTPPARPLTLGSP